MCDSPPKTLDVDKKPFTLKTGELQKFCLLVQSIEEFCAKYHHIFWCIIGIPSLHKGNLTIQGSEIL